MTTNMNSHRITIIDQVIDLVTFNLNRQYACVFVVKLFCQGIFIIIYMATA